MVKDVNTRVHHRTCNLCEAMCGLVITIKDDQVESIRGDVDDPFSQGHICPKATALQDIYADPDRLRQPVRRTESGWQTISWDEAYDEVAQRLLAVQAEHGQDAVAIYQGNPNVHNLGSMLYSPPFVRALRTRHRFSATSVDQLPHHFAAYFMFGHQLLLPVPDVDRTQFMLIIGANPLASNGSLMTAPGISRRLKAIQQRGGKVVVVDPRRTETADMADTHIFIRPGADVMLLLGILRGLFEEKRVNLGHLEAHVKDLEILRTVAESVSLADVSRATGISEDQIRQLTRDFAEAESAVCYGRVGVSMQAFGGVSQWLINAINIVSGNMDREGGAMFPLPAFDVVGLTSAIGQGGHFDRWRSRVRDLPEFSGELPSSIMAEEMLTPGEGRIRAMVTVAGNPVLSTPNGRQLDEALAGLDFMVSIDIYINETTRHAHIILPPTTGLETEHYDLVFHNLAVRNTAKYSPPAFDASPDARHDWQIFRALRERIEAAKGSKPPQRKEYQKRLSPSKIVDMALRFGPYGAWGVGKKRGEGLRLSTLQREVHGVDLGALKPILTRRLITDDRRIQLAPQVLLEDMARVKAHFFAAENAALAPFDLALIGRRYLRSNNSWMHNSERLVRGRDRCTLMMHPEDASARQLSDGQTVCVRSRVGEVSLPLEITDALMPGVVSMPHGWGHGRAGVRMRVAEAHAGASINDLTDDQLVDKLTGNAAFSGVRVMVEAKQVPSI